MNSSTDSNLSEEEYLSINIPSEKDIVSKDMKKDAKKFNAENNTTKMKEYTITFEVDENECIFSAQHTDPTITSPRLALSLELVWMQSIGVFTQDVKNGNEFKETKRLKRIINKYKKWCIKNDIKPEWINKE